MERDYKQYKALEETTELVEKSFENHGDPREPEEHAHKKPLAIEYGEAALRYVIIMLLI